MAAIEAIAAAAPAAAERGDRPETRRLVAAAERGDRPETKRLVAAAGRLCGEMAGLWPPTAVETQ